MNKQQLLDQISKLPDDIEFLASKDDEGNGYRWIEGVSVDYIHKSENNGYETDSVLSEEEVRDDYTEQEIAEDLVKVAIIW